MENHICFVDYWRFYFTFKSFLKYKQFKTVYFSSIFLVTLDEVRVCLSWVQWLWSEFTFQLVDNKHRKIQIEFQVFLQSIHYSILTIGTSSFFHCPCMKYFKIPLQIWIYIFSIHLLFLPLLLIKTNECWYWDQKS